MLGCMLLHCPGLGWQDTSVHISRQAVALITATISVSQPQFCAMLSGITRGIVGYTHKNLKFGNAAKKSKYPSKKQKKYFKLP